MLKSGKIIPYHVPEGPQNNSVTSSCIKPQKNERDK